MIAARPKEAETEAKPKTKDFKKDFKVKDPKVEEHKAKAEDPKVGEPNVEEPKRETERELKKEKEKKVEPEAEPEEVGHAALSLMSLITTGRAPGSSPSTTLARLAVAYEFRAQRAGSNQPSKEGQRATEQTCWESMIAPSSFSG